MTVFRAVQRVVEAQATSDGAGVRLRRSLGTAELEHLDPFLLLDEFKSEDSADYVGGFPDHPHRGFETVTYMLAGAMEHRDHRGVTGNLVAGSVQWMTAGRGIIHSEMPRQQDGLMWGFQLWVNLPARDKLQPPRYQDIPPDRIPEKNDGGMSVRVIAGRFRDLKGPASGIATDPLYLDVAMSRASRNELEVEAGHTAFCYVFDGEGRFGDTQDTLGRVIGPGHLIVLGDGDRLAVATTSSPVRFLLVAAKPIGEPVARYGPFVMNTREEIARAFRDYSEGTFLG